MNTYLELAKKVVFHAGKGIFVLAQLLIKLCEDIFDAFTRRVIAGFDNYHANTTGRDDEEEYEQKPDESTNTFPLPSLCVHGFEGYGNCLICGKMLY